jgi:phospholipid/cholesterol/gamma-HCH transport system ATP-binding protein
MSGRTPEPVLDLMGAFSAVPVSGFRRAPLDLRIMAGECVFVDTQHTSAATGLADICCGLLPLQSGLVRFLGQDWAHASDEQRAALRGQIGRLHGSNSWISTLGTDTNILLAQLHHTRRSELELREAAA